MPIFRLPGLTGLSVGGTGGMAEQVLAPEGRRLGSCERHDMTVLSRDVSDEDMKLAACEASSKEKRSPNT